MNKAFRVVFFLMVVFAVQAVFCVESHAMRIRISNPKIELELSPGETATGEIEVENPTEDKVKLRAYAEDWIYANATGEKKFQPAGTHPLSASNWIRVAPSETEISNMLFAFAVAKHVKSNAIVYAKEQATVGIGAGQMSRVDSSRIAAWKAREAAEAAGETKSRAVGSVVASDAFFPFADGLIAAAEAGATAVIQPGGSLRDNDVIEAADEAGLAMVFTGMRHFRH